MATVLKDRGTENVVQHVTFRILESGGCLSPFCLCVSSKHQVAMGPHRAGMFVILVPLNAGTRRSRILWLCQTLGFTIVPVCIAGFMRSLHYVIVVGRNAVVFVLRPTNTFFS